MAVEGKTPEQLQADVDKAMAQVEQLTAQVRGLAAERDQYRSQANQGGGDVGGANSGASSHVLGKVLGVDADYSAVDQYYVTRQQYAKDLQAAVNQAYTLARGDVMVLREIDRASTAYPDLSKWDSPLSKKTLDILQKEGYGAPRRDPATGAVMAPSSWEDLVYENVKALPRAARMAQAELVLAQQQAATDAAQQQQAQGAAGMASGGAPASVGQTISDEAWMKVADAGDTAAMRELLKAHATAVTGQPG